MLTEFDQVVGDQIGSSYERVRAEYQSALVFFFAACIANILRITRTDHRPRISSRQLKAFIMDQGKSPVRP